MIREWTAKEILAHYKSLVWPEIEKYLVDPPYPIPFQIPRKYAGDISLNWKIATDYPKRQGKYLRPTLLLLTTEAMGVKANYAVKTAAAMQVSEDWLLIHDDIEDDSDLRRGLPTLHKIYGLEQAINAGDTIHVIMWRILADNFQILDTKTSIKILKEFSSMLVRTAIGQSTEINWAKSEKHSTDQDWFFIADGKTSYYTIAGPMRLGAIIAGASLLSWRLKSQGVEKISCRH